MTAIPRSKRKQVVFQCHLSPNVYEILKLLAEKRNARRSTVVCDALVLMASLELGRKAV